MRKGGGIMGSNNGSMLVAPTADGTRPGYYGADAGFGGSDYKDASAAFDAGSGSGENNSQGITYQDVRNNTTIQAGINNAAREKAKQQAAAAKEQKRIQDIIDSHKGKQPAAYGYGSPIVNPYNRRFGPKTKRESIASKFRKLALKDLADKKRGDKQLSFSAPLNFFNSLKPSRQDVDYSYNTPITTDMMNVNETDYIDQGNYGITGGNLTDIDRINRALDDGRSLGNITQKEFEDAFNSQNINTSNGGDGQPYLPINYNMASEAPEDEYTNDFTYRFGNNQNVGRDVTDATYAADGGIMGTRARRAMGGIMGRVDQRQQFFLGGIGKAIKGAFSGVVDATKKVLKSPIGQAALIYGGGAMLGSYGAGKGFFSPGMFNPGNMGKGLLGLKGKYDKLGTFGKIATMGGLGLGLSMIPGLNKAKPNETNFSDRGGPLLNSQGDGSQGSISREIQEAYASGDSQRIMELQKYYNYMLPSQDAVQDLSLPSSLPYPNYAEGGRIGKAEGGLLNMGGMEKDYRNDGGFVPIGEYEKKDDVPARLSVNEFVFTADAVRNAGEGDIDKGAEVMENMMKNLENGGTVSEESQGNQGNTGAQDMFSVSQRLGEVI